MMLAAVLLLALVAQPPNLEQTGQRVDAFRAGAPSGGWASHEIPAECRPRSCVGEAFSVYRFPPGARRPTDPPGTFYPNGWKVRVELGEAATAVFDPGFRGEVARVVFCRPWGDPLPWPVCMASAVVETADLFADGFESGDTSAWTRSVT